MAHVRVPPNHYMSNLIASFFPEEYRGHAVDVGASDGVSVNSTFGLERLRRWTVLSVEPNPQFWPVLISERVWVERCACGKSPGKAIFHVNVQTPEAYSTIGPQPDKERLGNTEWKDIEVCVETVDRLLDKWAFPSLDVLCVDVEGTELDVLEGANLDRWKPRIVVAESWVEGKYDDYMREHGYRKARRQIHNEVYERIR